MKFDVMLEQKEKKVKNMMQFCWKKSVVLGK